MKKLKHKIKNSNKLMCSCSWMHKQIFVYLEPEGSEKYILRKNKDVWWSYSLKSCKITSSLNRVMVQSFIIL
jgi:hypothetical protein